MCRQIFIKEIYIKLKIYAFIIIIYIVVIGRFFKDQLFGESIGIPAAIYFSILLFLFGLFIKNYKPVKRKKSIAYLTGYSIIAFAIFLFYYVRK